jgi:hypothetical protein
MQPPLSPPCTPPPNLSYESLKHFAYFILLIAVTLAFAGCQSEPRVRLGAIPCPGVFTLYKLADPADLGSARFESTPRFAQKDEQERGIIYTRRAGFLDLAHLRETMDWSWYASNKVAHALDTRQPSISFTGYDDCQFTLTFNYPDDWDTLPPAEKAHIQSQLSRKIGELVAFHGMTWHEITTWFGLRTTLIIPEDASSFTYEDTMSHLIGIYAADDALRNPTGDWDKDATRALARQLDHLGVVSKRQASLAVARVHGQWWEEGQCIKRNLDTGRDTGAIRPWLVRDFPPVIAHASLRLTDTPSTPSSPIPGPIAESFPLPSLSNIAGRDFSSFWQMSIKPNLMTPQEVKNVSKSAHHAIDPDIHFPIMIEKIRAQMKEKFGPEFDRPYTDWPPKSPTLVTDRSLD